MENKEHGLISPSGDADRTVISVRTPDSLSAVMPASDTNSEPAVPSAESPRSHVSSASIPEKSVSLSDEKPSSPSQRIPQKTDVPTNAVSAVTVPMSSRGTPSTGKGTIVTDVIAKYFQPGCQIDQFQLLEMVGGGGMGRVFRARDLQLDRLVALKILSADPMTRETALRFHNEAKSAARLNHRNISQVYQYGEFQGVPYIVFEYIEGENLRILVEHAGPLPLDVAIGYTIQIAGAMIHAAHYQVVHRDIKPSNVLVTPEGYVKLIDLGLARLGGGLDHEELTATGVTLGTFDYIAPEQALDPRTADSRSDIYSLGCTLFFMLTGRPPFGSGTVLQKLVKHQTLEVPEVRRLRPDLPLPVSQLLRRMMAKSPSRRFQNPESLLAALVDLVDDLKLQLDVPEDQFLPSSRSSWKRLLEQHLPWLVPTLLVVLTAILLQWSDRSSSQTVDENASAPYDTYGLPDPYSQDAKTANPPNPPADRRDAFRDTTLPSSPASPEVSTPNGGYANGISGQGGSGEAASLNSSVSSEAVSRSVPVSPPEEPSRRSYPSTIPVPDLPPLPPPDRGSTP
ncbi:MAG: serine/threonine-protein kinase [Thermoguttaceae bacterium]|nr:serine/threonine-protein kinase [Thermoguttaceae bacterium]